MRVARCGKCKNPLGPRDEHDGARIGGLPGIRYQLCRNCGWVHPIAKRRTKEPFKKAKV